MAQNQLPDWPLQAEEYVVCEFSVFRCKLGTWHHQNLGCCGHAEEKGI